MQIKIGHKFADPKLLEMALTHPSHKSNKNGVANYERLEFLGDSVLQLLVSEFLYDNFPEESEGNLAKRRAALVCGESLVKIAREINLGENLKLGAGEDSSGGRDNAANLENALEAVIGALYIDGGLPAARQFVFKHLGSLATSMIEAPKDPKTHLQELLQAEGKAVPEYKIVEQKGPSHNPVFTVEVTAEGFAPERAEGKSRRVAEREAAQKMINKVIF